MKTNTLKSLGFTKHDKAQRLARNRNRARHASIDLLIAQADAIVLEETKATTELLDGSLFKQCGNAKRLQGSTPVNVHGMLKSLGGLKGALNSMNVLSLKGAYFKVVLFTNYQHAYRRMIERAKYIAPQDTEAVFIEGVEDLALNTSYYMHLIYLKGAEFGGIAKGINYALTVAFGKAFDRYAKDYADNAKYTIDIDSETKNGTPLRDLIEDVRYKNDGYDGTEKTVNQTLLQDYGMTQKQATSITKAYKTLNNSKATASDKRKATYVVYKFRKAYNVNVEAQQSKLANQYRTRNKRANATNQTATGLDRVERRMVKKANETA